MFPIPRESPVRSGHGRRFELIGSEDQKKIALHYLIRKPGNKFSERIATYDKLFSRNMDSHYNVDDAEIERQVFTQNVRCQVGPMANCSTTFGN